MIKINLSGKFWETVSNGTGGALAPWRIRRDGKALADAKRDEMLMLAQTENDVVEIKAGKKKYTDEHKLITLIPEDQPADAEPLVELQRGRVEPYINLEALEQEAQIRKQAQSVQEQINLTKTVLMAEEELENNEYEGNEESVDPDWFVRWRDSAEKVSNEDLQRLWAKALAGEVASPGSYSLRTLEFLKNISQAEAHEIARLAPYTINGFIHNLPYLEGKGLAFGFLLEMEDLGILSGVKGGGLEVTWTSFAPDKYTRNIQYGSKLLLVEQDQENATLKCKVYKVTKLGNEVLKLGVFPLDYGYLEQIGLDIKTRKFNVKLADLTEVTPNYVRYANARDI